MACEKTVKESEKGGDEAIQSLTPPLNAAIILPLFYAEVHEKKLALKVLGLQALVALIATAFMVFAKEDSSQDALAMFAGGAVSALNGALLAWRMSRVSRYATQGAHQQLRFMYYCAAERFLLVVLSLAICMAVLRWSPIFVLGGFVLGQSVLLTARLFLKIKTEDSE